MLPSPKSKIWNYNENEMMIIDPNITWTPTYHFYEDIATYCQLQKIALHPCFLKEHVYIYIYIYSMNPQK